MSIVAICGSMTFFDEMKQLQRELDSLGYKSCTPAEEVEGTDYATMSEQEQATYKQGFFDGYIEIIKKSDILVVANYPKHGIEGYIGANTFLEMGFAYVLKKPIYTLYPLPEQPNKAELLGLTPVVLQGDLHKLPSAS